jgi:hypothetical protein
MSAGPEKGQVFMPPQSFKKSIQAAAKYLSIRIPGEGKATWSKHFRSGVLVVEPLVLPTKVEDVEGLWLHVPADGQPGGRRRVAKCFPVFQEWEGEVQYMILDEKITKDTFAYHLEQAGQFIGLGFFRPENGGYYGRYSVEKITWKNGS